MTDNIIGGSMSILKKFLTKKTIIIAGILLTALILFFLFLITRQESYRLIKVFELSGSVLIDRDGEATVEAYENMNLISGDRVTVGNEGFMRILLDSDKYVYLEPGTIISLEAAGTEKNSETTINLEQGAILCEVEKKLNNKSSFEIATPNSTMAIRGTTWYVRIDTESTQVSVLDGTVQVYTDGTDGTDTTVDTSTLTGGQIVNIIGIEQPKFEGEPREIEPEDIPLEIWKIISTLVDSSDFTFYKVQDIESMISYLNGLKTEGQEEQIQNSVEVEPVEDVDDAIEPEEVLEEKPKKTPPVVVEEEVIVEPEVVTEAVTPTQTVTTPSPSSQNTNAPQPMPATSLSSTALMVTSEQSAALTVNNPIGTITWDIVYRESFFTYELADGNNNSITIIRNPDMPSGTGVIRAMVGNTAMYCALLGSSQEILEMPTSITLGTSALDMYENDNSYELSYSFESESQNADIELDFYSSDESVVQVYRDGLIYISPVAPGTATVTASALDGSVKAVCTITVLPATLGVYTTVLIAEDESVLLTQPGIDDYTAISVKLGNQLVTADNVIVSNEHLHCDETGEDGEYQLYFDAELLSGSYTVQFEASGETVVLNVTIE